MYVTCVQVGAVLLLAALLFLCGEMLKRTRMGRHWIPAALGALGILMAAGLGLADGVRLWCAVAGGVPSGLMGAALCVYIHQLGAQMNRRDAAQAPFVGFYFNKEGEGL